MSIKEGLCIIIPKEKSKGVRANVLLFVYLMMMMVMMAVSASAFYFDVTVLFVTVLAVLFKLKSCVNDSVFRQLFFCFTFYSVSITVCDDVHCGVTALTVHCPNMNVMNVKNAVNFAQVCFNLIYVDPVRRFDKENVNR